MNSHSSPGFRFPIRIGLLCAVLLTATATGVVASGAQLVDRIVAIVDDDPILYSEIERAIGLGLVAGLPGEARAALERRVLDRLIDERLRLHQVDRFGLVETPLDELDRQVNQVTERAGGPEQLAESLAEAGMTVEDLRAQLALQLQLLGFIEQRLGPRVSVSLEEIRAYYDNELVPMLEQRTDPDLDPDSESLSAVPPVEEVREEIRALLYQRGLDAELERWTLELRRDADVVDLLERDDSELPLLDRRGAEEPAAVPEKPP